MGEIHRLYIPSRATAPPTSARLHSPSSPALPVAATGRPGEESGDDMEKLARDALEAEVIDVSLGDDDDVEWTRGQIRMEAKDLPHPALECVAPYSVAHLAGDRDADARTCGAARSDVVDEASTVQPRAVSLRPQELVAAPQAKVGREAEPGLLRQELESLLLRDLHREVLAALAPAR